MTNWYETQLDQHKQIEKNSPIAKKLEDINHKNVLNDLKNIIETYPDIALESLNHLVEYASVDRLKEVVSILSQKLEIVTQQMQQQPQPQPNTDTFDINTNNTSTPKATSSRSTSSTSETSPNSPSIKLDKQSSANSSASRK
jgi:hypothetical protein